MIAQPRSLSAIRRPGALYGAAGARVTSARIIARARFSEVRAAGGQVRSRRNEMDALDVRVSRDHSINAAAG